MNTSSMSRRELLVLLKKENVVKKGNFTLKSGRQSNYYVDFRPLISKPELFATLCNHLATLLPDKDTITPYFVCGLPYAGIPYCSVISIMNMIPMIMLRKETKNHGTKKMIEGTINSEDEVVLLDDILTTGASVLESLGYFKEYKIKKILVVLDREEGGKKRLEEYGFEVESLFTIKDFQ